MSRGSAFRPFQADGVRVGPPRPPSPPVGPLIRRLERQEMEAASAESQDESAKITDSAYVASYNWLKGGDPTIMVPGVPRAWTPVGGEQQLKEDEGDYFRDPNAARFYHPLEPAVQAVLAVQGDFNAQEIDIVACSSTLGNVLQFARGFGYTFRFFVQVVGDTVFFLSHENSPVQVIEGVTGYGHTFPDANTTWDDGVKGSVSHQRLLKYRFAGISCVVRSGCDGYIPSKVSEEEVIMATSSVDHENQDRTSQFSENQLVASASVGGRRRTGLLNVIHGGRVIPQAAVFDFKTRGSDFKGMNVVQEQLPRLWVSQIPSLVLAYHERGSFSPEDIHVVDVQDRVTAWEHDNQRDIKCLAWLLREIVAAAKARKDRKLEVCRKGSGPLEMREQATDESVLPVGLALQWSAGVFTRKNDTTDVRTASEK